MFGPVSNMIVRATYVSSTTLAAPVAADFTSNVYFPNTPSTGQSLNLAKKAAFRVELSAESGQTLSGAGNLRCYLLEMTRGGTQVLRNPQLDLAVPAGAAGSRFISFPDQIVAVPDGSRLMYVADAVTVSGGTTVTIDIIASTQV